MQKKAAGENPPHYAPDTRRKEGNVLHKQKNAPAHGRNDNTRAGFMRVLAFKHKKSRPIGRPFQSVLDYLLKPILNFRPMMSPGL